MPGIVQCPQCGSKYTATDEQMGLEFNCPKCATAFQATPASTAPAPATPATPTAPNSYGQPSQAATPTPYAASTGGTGKAIASLVLGIVSIPCCIFYGVPSLICGILAVVFSKSSKTAIASGTMPASSGGFAKAGGICGVVGIVLSIIYWIILIAGVAFFQSNSRVIAP